MDAVKVKWPLHNMSSIQDGGDSHRNYVRSPSSWESTRKKAHKNSEGVFLGPTIPFVFVFCRNEYPVYVRAFVIDGSQMIVFDGGLGSYHLHE